MKAVEFKFDIDEMVDDKFGNSGVVIQLAFCEPGHNRYLIEFSDETKWLDEDRVSKTNEGSGRKVDFKFCLNDEVQDNSGFRGIISDLAYRRPGYKSYWVEGVGNSRWVLEDRLDQITEK